MSYYTPKQIVETVSNVAATKASTSTPKTLVLAFLAVVLVCLSLDASTRVALYIAPLWFALLTIGYRLYAVKPEQRQSLAQAQQQAA